MAAVDVRTMVGSTEIQKEKKNIHPFFGGPRSEWSRLIMCKWDVVLIQSGRTSTQIEGAPCADHNPQDNY